MTDYAARPPYMSLSRQDKKRVKTLNAAAASQVFEDKERELKHLAEELQLTRQRLANALATLEAVVRRHGRQSFDRQTVQSVCAKGHVQFDVMPDRITVRLRDEPVLAADDIVNID